MPQASPPSPFFSVLLILLSLFLGYILCYYYNIQYSVDLQRIGAAGRASGGGGASALPQIDVAATRHQYARPPSNRERAIKSALRRHQSLSASSGRCRQLPERPIGNCRVGKLSVCNAIRCLIAVSMYCNRATASAVWWVIRMVRKARESPKYATKMTSMYR